MLNEWCKLDIFLKKAKNTKRFVKSLLKDSLNLKQKSLFAIRIRADVKLLSRLQLKFNHLNEYKFLHNFKDALSPGCGSETEATDPFFLCCLLFAINRQKPKIDPFFKEFQL